MLSFSRHWLSAYYVPGPVLALQTRWCAGHCSCLTEARVQQRREADRKRVRMSGVLPRGPAGHSQWEPVTGAHPWWQLRNWELRGCGTCLLSGLCLAGWVPTTASCSQLKKDSQELHADGQVPSPLLTAPRRQKLWAGSWHHVCSQTLTGPLLKLCPTW